jgi:hypothetical protein
VRKRPSLYLEQLEDRCVTTAIGGLWPDARHLTLSFVPDGTPTATGTSSFFSRIASGSSPAAVEQTILRAFQTWAQYSNVNISLTGDDGEAFGAAGLVQGDPRFGDIRIGADALNRSTVATATGYQPSGTTWSGDVLFNSNYSFGNGPGQYDLFTVALHEAGHVFGLVDETADSNSVEYQYYTGPRTGLAPSDILALQAQYGVRTGDAFQANGGNHTLATATNLNSVGGTPVCTILIAQGDVTTQQDVEYYRFTTDLASHPNGVLVQLQASRLSVVTAQLTVFDQSGNAIASAVTADPLNNDLTIHLSQVTPGATYYVAVQGSQAGALAIGAYQLAVNLQPSAASVGAPGQFGNAQTLAQVNSLNGNELGTAGLISIGNDTNVFTFKTKSGPYVNGLTVTLQTWGSGLGAPTLAVFDAAGNQLCAAYSVLPDGTFSLHVDGIAANSTYYVRAVTPALNAATHGSFAVQVDLNAPAGTQPTVSPFLQTVVTDLLGGLLGVVSGVLSLLGLGSRVPPATTLTTVPGYAPQTKYQTVGGLSSPSARACYRIQSAPAAAGQTDVMTVSVMAQFAQALSPDVRVFDGQMNPVGASVLANANGVIIVQVANAVPIADYLIMVGAAQRPNKANTGAYVLDVTFGGTAAPANQTYAADTLSSAAPQDVRTLSVSQNQLFSFVLSANTGGSTQAAEVQMQIVDANGNMVYSQIAYAGQQATTGNVYLQSGSYTVRFTAVPKTPGQLPALTYTLAGLVLSDPQGPQATDPSADNSTAPPPSDTSTTTTDTSSTYYWSDPNYAYSYGYGQTYPSGQSYTYQ